MTDRRGDEDAEERQQAAAERGGSRKGPVAARALHLARRAGTLSLKFVVGVYVFYLVVVNAALNWGGFHRWLGSQQEIIQLEIERAYSWRPFSVHMENFEIWVREGPVEVYIAGDEVDADYDPWPMTDRVVAFSRVEGDGFELRLRLRYPEGERPSTAPRGLAEFPDWGPLPAPVTEPMSDGDLSNNWNVDMRGIDVALDQVWIDRVRYRGRLAVTGGFILFTEQTIELPRVEVKVDPGRLDLAGVPLSDAFTSTLGVELPQWSIADIDLERLVTTLRLDVDLDLPLASTEAITEMAEVSPSTVSGSGRVRLELGLAEGKVRDDSRLRVEGRDLQARVDESVAALDELDVDIAMNDQRLAGHVRAVGAGQHPPWPEVRLTKLDVEGGVDLPSILDGFDGPEMDAHVHVSVPHFSLGAAHGFEKARMKGKLGGALHVELRRNADAMANLGIEGKVTAQHGAARFEGPVAARLFARGDLRARRLANLRGHLEAESRRPAWRSRVEVDRGRAEPGRARVLVGVEMSDLDPLLDLEPLDDRVPDLAAALLDLRHLSVASQLDYDDGRTTLRILRAEMESLESVGMVQFGGDQPPAGAIMIGVAGTTWGIEISGADVSVTPFVGRAWGRERFAALDEGERPAP
ncbi:MAG: hypothetical protein AAGN82_29825 [Myxococcota bacterium]